jgi:hypothetical protein
MRVLLAMVALMLVAGCGLTQPAPWAYPAPDPDIGPGNSRLPIQSPNDKNHDKTMGDT